MRSVWTILLSRTLWTVALVFAVWLLMSAWNDSLLVGLLGDGGWLLVNTILLGAIMLCSGVLLFCEWRDNPVSDSERGEWTGPMLLYSTVFTVTFFIGVYSFFGWFFS